MPWSRASLSHTTKTRVFRLRRLVANSQLVSSKTHEYPGNTANRTSRHASNLTCRRAAICTGMRGGSCPDDDHCDLRVRNSLRLVDLEVSAVVRLACRGERATRECDRRCARRVSRGARSLPRELTCAHTKIPNGSVTPSGWESLLAVSHVRIGSRFRTGIRR